MPLTHKGTEFSRAWRRPMGPVPRRSVHRSKNAGKITGIDAVADYMDACARGDSAEIATARDELHRRK